MEFSKQLLARVAELHLSTDKMVSSLLSGNFRSSFRGSGMQFKEFRSYEPGDDIRYMSWPVTARRGRPTIKVFEEERELSVVVVVDGSGSSLVGHEKKNKLEMYGELTALLGLAAVKTRDNVGLLLFDEQPVHYMPPKNTRTQVRQMMAHVLNHNPQGKKSDLASSLSFLSQTLKQRSLILVLSDFLVPDFSKQLIKLSSKHETVLFHCFDDIERGQLSRGLIELWDSETEQTLILDTKKKAIRSELARQHTALQNRVEQTAMDSKSDYFCLSVQDDYLQRLVQFFRRRGPSRL